jgi:hypothetical protein
MATQSSDGAQISTRPLPDVRMKASAICVWVREGKRGEGKEGNLRVTLRFLM